MGCQLESEWSGVESSGKSPTVVDAGRSETWDALRVRRNAGPWRQPVSNAETAPPSGSTGGPRVLFVYYTLSQQAARVSRAMTDALEAEGCEVTEAVIEFTDPRYARSFDHFP